MPDESNPKTDLMVEAAREYTAFYGALHGLNEEHMAEVWLGAWSIKEIVAHMSGWHREMMPALQRLARGERPVPPGVSYDDVDAWNARFVATVADREVTDLLLDLDRSHEEFMQAAGHVPAERYEPGKTAYRIVESSSVRHYREHGDQIRAWRTSREI